MKALIGFDICSTLTQAVDTVTVHDGVVVCLSCGQFIGVERLSAENYDQDVKLSSGLEGSRIGIWTTATVLYEEL